MVGVYVVKLRKGDEKEGNDLKSKVAHELTAFEPNF